MIQTFSRLGALALFGVTLGACDQLPTASGGQEQSRFVLRSSTVTPSLSTPLFSRAGGGRAAQDGNGHARNGPIALGAVSAIDVQITRIALLVEGSTPIVDADEEAQDREDQKWVDLEFDFDPTSTRFNLRDLGAGATLGLVPETLTGEILAVRLYFGDAKVVFTDGTEEDLFIPSGKVTIPTAGVMVNRGQDVAVVFESGSSIRKIIRTGRGLLMPPVFMVENGRSDDAGENGQEAGGNGPDDGDDDSDEDADDTDTGDSDDSDPGDDEDE